MKKFWILALWLWLVGLPATAQTNTTVQLNAGWNAVAFRCGTVTALNASSTVSVMAVFDGTTYQIRPLSVEELNSGDGTRRAFWCFCTGPGNLTYAGTDEPGPGLNLRSGWNLVSFPGRAQALSGSSLTLRRSGLAANLTQFLLPQFYELDGSGNFTVVDVGAGGSLRPGRAYWLFCNSNNVTLSYGGSEPLTFSAAGALAAANATILGLSTSLSDNPDNPTLDTTRLGGLAQSTVLLAASLTAGGSRTLTSGGTAVVVVNGNSATLTFNGYRTANATLNGTIATSLTGTLLSGTFTANANYTAFTVAVNAGPTYQFDGTASLARTRTGSGTVTIHSDFAANFTAADTSGPFIRYDNALITTDTSISGGAFSGTQSWSGAVSFQNYAGTTGRVVVTTPTALAFSGTLTSIALTGGQALFTGDGALRLTVTAPNSVEVAVRLPGTNLFVVVGSFSWSTLGGATSLASP